MTILIGLVFIIAGFTLFYALALRPWLKTKPWAIRFFAWIDPIELVLYKKSETVLLGRLIWLGSGIVTAYDAIGGYLSGLDFTPITTRLFDAVHVPPDLRGLTLSAFVTAIGFMIVNLRKRVTKPLELVAVADKDVTPRIAKAIAIADATKTEAIAAMQMSKAI